MDLVALTGKISSLVWSDALIFLCLGAGLFFSIKMRFPQFRLIKGVAKFI